MPALRGSTLMEYLIETCEILLSRWLILEHALAFLANQQLRCHVSQSIPHQRWLLRVYNHVYGRMGHADLDMGGGELDSLRHWKDAKGPYENRVSCGEKKIEGPKDLR